MLSRMNDRVEIFEDDLSDGQLIELLELHRQEMLKHSPPENVHALDLDAMRSSDLTFWSARNTNELGIIACGAIKHLDTSHAELKSMKVSDAYVGNGVGRLMLDHLVEAATKRGYQCLSLETGTMDAFIPARRLYESRGFVACPPFADYFVDPHSMCMSLALE